MKTTMSRFTDPRRPVGPRGVAAGAARCALDRRSAAELPRRAGRLAGGAARLCALPRRAAARRRSSSPTLERISLAVAEHYGSAPGISLHSRTARSAGLGLDEVARAREFDSGDPKQAALLRYLKAALEGQRRPARCTSTRRRASSAGTTRSCSRRSRSSSLEVFTAMINIAGDVPVDGSVEESRTLRAA